MSMTLLMHYDSQHWTIKKRHALEMREMKMLQRMSDNIQREMSVVEMKIIR